MGGNRRRLEIITRSPVLTIAQVRTVFGLGEPSIDASPMHKPEREPPIDASPKPNFYLIGHAFEGDFEDLEQAGIRVTDFYKIAGIIDTKILVEDLHESINVGTNWPLGLAALVLRYDLYPSRWSARARSGKGAEIFIGCHNGGNDAIANLKLFPPWAIGSSPSKPR